MLLWVRVHLWKKFKLVKKANKFKIKSNLDSLQLIIKAICFNWEKINSKEKQCIMLIFKLRLLMIKTKILIFPNIHMRTTGIKSYWINSLWTINNWLWLRQTITSQNLCFRSSIRKNRTSNLKMRKKNNPVLISNKLILSKRILWIKNNSKKSVSISNWLVKLTNLLQ